jgi:hypothetical protein
MMTLPSSIQFQRCRTARDDRGFDKFLGCQVIFDGAPFRFFGDNEDLDVNSFSDAYAFIDGYGCALGNDRLGEIIQDIKGDLIMEDPDPDDDDDSEYDYNV